MWFTVSGILRGYCGNTGLDLRLGGMHMWTQTGLFEILGSFMIFSILLKMAFSYLNLYVLVMWEDKQF
jgi:hypothetical protein